MDIKIQSIFQCSTLTSKLTSCILQQNLTTKQLQSFRKRKWFDEDVVAVVKMLFLLFVLLSFSRSDNQGWTALPDCP